MSTKSDDLRDPRGSCAERDTVRRHTAVIADDDCEPFPWGYVRTLGEREDEEARRERLRVEREADALAAASPLVAALLGLGGK